MLNKYKNELLDVIKKSHFSVSDFVASEPDSPEHGKTFTLVHTPSNFHLEVWNDPRDFDSFRGFYTDFVPGLIGYYFPNDTNYAFEELEYCDIMELVAHCTQWLEGIDKYNEDLATPDLWANITDSQNIINETDKESLEYFLPAEKDSIRLAIRDFKQLMEKKFEMDTEQHAIVFERLDYLTKAVDKSNKFDWKGIALNTIISISITLSLDADRGRQLFELFKTVFGSIVRMLH